ncbi:MAG: SPOR domain-containing protein [Alphaproteobacteria bacterium]|jgi:flagellar motility protein MotE (MotC chaperone)|nr:SPOR domain-containing protein [Alphaproteobacteria bacterium]
MNKDKIFRFVTGVVFIIFMVAIFSSYFSAKQEDNINEAVPVVSADQSPIKIKPEDEGGMDIPFRETEIYESASSDVDDTETSKLKDSKKDLKIKFEETEVKTEKDVEDLDDLINVLSGKENKKIETKKAIKKIVESKPSPFGIYRVQLGSLRSRNDAVNAWKKLKKKYSGTLDGLKGHIEKVNTSRGGFYRVQTSKTTKTRASKVCNVIKNCLIVKAK